MEIRLHNPTTQESEVVLVPALAWLLTKPIFYAALRAAIPTFEAERKGQQHVCIQNKNKSLSNIQRNKIFIRYTFFVRKESVKKGSSLESYLFVCVRCPSVLIKILDYLWRCLSRPELRPPLWDASQKTPLCPAKYKAGRAQDLCVKKRHIVYLKDN